MHLSQSSSEAPVDIIIPPLFELLKIQMRQNQCFRAMKTLPGKGLEIYSLKEDIRLFAEHKLAFKESQLTLI